MNRIFTLLLFLASTIAVKAQTTYNFYYGNLHAHSSYSDGNQDAATSGHYTPLQNYVYANGSLHFDFLGISEHNHATAGMQLVNYAKGLRQADSATVNGQFVALYGMEWGTISGGGHVLVYGVNQLLNWETNNYDVFVPKSDYQALFKQINSRPGAFATLAHPQSGDYGNLAGSGTAFSPRADSAIVGTVMRSGPATSTNVTYSNPSNSSYESTYRTLLAKGYHLGISLDHDNHNTTFGRTTQGRVVAIAPSLTQTDIMQAFRERRFYASDDWNAVVNYTLNNQPIGSIFTGSAAATININVTDGDSEGVQSITLLKGVPGSGQNAVTVATASAGSTALTYVDPSASGSAYYYAVIIQPDGDRIVTSPIWYTRSTVNSIPEFENELAFKVYPNPASGSPVTISYYLAGEEEISLTVLDMLGREIASPVKGERQVKGSYSYPLNIATESLGQSIYTVRLIHNGSVSYRKLILVK